MKDMIREYFEIMLSDGFEIEAAKENLLEIIDEIEDEYNAIPVTKEDICNFDKEDALNALYEGGE